MMLIILAWKNIWRNKKRSFIILTATSIGLAAGLFSVGVLTGIYDSLVDSEINRELGNIQIHTREFNEDQLFSQSIPDPEGILSKISSHPDVANVSTHSKIEGMAASTTTSFGVIIIGIMPDKEKQITAVSKCIVEGKYFDKNNSIVIGKKLAEKLKLKLNSKIVLNFSGIDGNIIYAAFRISGIFDTYSSGFDASNVFVRQDDLSSLLGYTAPIHEIVIRTKNSVLLEKTKLEINNLLSKNLIAESWKDIAPDLKMTADSTDLINAIFLGLILCALLFGLTNTLLMSVLDRIRDFGVLLAIGLFRRRLFSIIILESFFLSATGGIIGVFSGWLITKYFNSSGIDLSIVSQGLSVYGIPSILYPHINESAYFTLALMIIVTSILAALYPAIKAVRLKPVEAIRSIA
jgi:putative ABC transport system permease protein